MLDRSKLPTLPIRPVDPATEAAYQEFTAEHVDVVRPDVPTLEAPGPIVAYLQWLATHRRVMFHGTKRGGLDELRILRETRDESDFGDQQAVFASDDPVWAMFFAVLARDGALTSTRNGTMSTVGDPLRRRYFLSVNEEVGAGEEKSAGWMYVLPPEGFVSERPRYGHLYTSHWVSREPVRALVRFAVQADDFPLPIVRHPAGESILRTIRRARQR